VSGLRPPTGPWKEICFSVPAPAEGEAAAALAEWGALGVSVDQPSPGSPQPDPVRLRAFFEATASVDPEDLARRLAALPGGAASVVVSITEIKDGRWVERWIEALAPFPVGDRFLVVPIGDAEETIPFRARKREAGARIGLRICPSRAFGTGEHPTTRLCLLAMESIPLEGRSFLDVGTGSGILALAARYLGADPVTGFDVDAEAIEVARANASQNPAAGPIDLIVSAPSDVKGPPRDVVAANLNSAILEKVLGELARLTAPGGRLILSGLLDHEAEPMAALAASHALGNAIVTRLGGWAAVLLERQGA